MWAPRGRCTDLCEGPRSSNQPPTQTWGQREAMTNETGKVVPRGP